jgi:hypothetical protein
MRCIIMIMGWHRLTRLMGAKSNMAEMDSTASYMESIMHQTTTLRSFSIPTRAERFNTCCVTRSLVSLSNATPNKYP